MSIVSGFKKVKNYIKETDGYKLLSRWTSSDTVDVNGKTLTEAINGLNTSINGKANSVHTHGNGDITSLDASKITSGTIDIDRLPQGALDRLIKVADDTARFKLTTKDVQLGDSVKVTSTKKMYIVVNETKLSSEDGYEPYTADSATSVPWSGVTGKPSTYTPSSHTHTKSQITDFPTSMPANGGNSTTVNGHTVKSDVPENAVFTDTVYDDTEVKESIDELNSNLSDLAYGERSGNKNLLDVSKIKEMPNVVRYGDYGFKNIATDTRTESYPFINLYDGDTLVAGGTDLTKTSSSGIVKAYATFTTAQPINIVNIGHSGAVTNFAVRFNMNLPAGTYTISMDIVKDNPSIVGGFEFKNIQIEEGTSVTDYEPYIPSVKMLADEVSAQKNDLEWKLLADNVAVGTSTNVVSGAREYYVVAKYGTINITTLIPSIVLGKTIFDGHYSSASDNSRIQINTTTSGLSLVSFIYGGSVKDDATYSVYYR